MKILSKRILTLLLTAVMIASFVQLNVFAADEIAPTSTTPNVSLEVAVRNEAGIDLSDRDNDLYEFLIYAIDETTGNAMAGETFVYDVVDVKSGETVAKAQTVEHEKTFKLEGGQRAVFNDMTIGTTYTFTEVQNAAQRFIPTAKFNGENVNLSFAYSVNTGVLAEGQVYDVDFINILTPTTVTLKYYDRVISDGKQEINSEAKAVSFDYYGTEVEYNVIDDVAYIANYPKLIVDAPGRMGLNLPDNILDDYALFTSTEQAANDIKNNFFNYHTGANYIYTKYHTNNYGYTQDDSGKFADTTDGDGEEWVVVDDDNNTITAWLFNRPKRYTVNTYGVTNELTSQALSKIDNARYVNSTITSTRKAIAYYNQRMGQRPLTGTSGDTTTYLQKYGIEGYTGVTATTNETAITEDGKLVEFLYWAFDAEGTKIASTDFEYNYRITSDTNLFAIYGVEGAKTVSGVTLRESSYDLYADDNNISRIRLNSVLNPYGNYADNNATTISDVAILYLNMKDVADGAVADEIKGVKEQLKQILIENNDAYSISGKSVTLSNNNTIKVNGFTYDVVSKNEADTQSEVYLTSKNRVQFSTSFKMEQFENLRLCAVSAVCINGKWILTDNYIDYLPSSYLN